MPSSAKVPSQSVLSRSKITALILLVCGELIVAWVSNSDRKRSTAFTRHVIVQAICVHKAKTSLYRCSSNTIDGSRTKHIGKVGCHPAVLQFKAQHEFTQSDGALATRLQATSPGTVLQRISVNKHWSRRRLAEAREAATELDVELHEDLFASFRGCSIDQLCSLNRGDHQLVLAEDDVVERLRVKRGLRSSRSQPNGSCAVASSNDTCTSSRTTRLISHVFELASSDQVRPSSTRPRELIEQVAEVRVGLLFRRAAEVFVQDADDHVAVLRIGRETEEIARKLLS